MVCKNKFISLNVNSIYRTILFFFLNIYIYRRNTYSLPIPTYFCFFLFSVFFVSSNFTFNLVFIFSR